MCKKTAREGQCGCVIEGREGGGGCRSEEEDGHSKMVVLPAWGGQLHLELTGIHLWLHLRLHYGP